uniref:sushi, von Willebrand factor type A, EGF and pentraxin domain-containing protein 1 isoform X1 n=1 Tax=Ciona intestinalis TaxID=7719 RepID=UPI000180C3AC|nr:sushi, von Willebrand factor type A, EGF and pentraxin domain-containing protein 1 isoform X1 [Ciona intestinalis]|eukprot:XP_026693505.1 sushi, von Willebrand factor type A, EGF and pentraxin domain-containing protein 1 isoform X1 [Ciona intestinalis]
MKLLLHVASLAAVIFAVDGLKCWVCDNARTNAECLARGRLWQCQPNQRACQTEVRRDPQGMRITKRCKQALACDNNFIQNPRAAWFPSQCSDQHGSVCRCCCDFDNCNTGTIGCNDRPAPKCPRPSNPTNGAVTCPGTGMVSPGDVCTYTCVNGYNMTGSTASRCVLTSQTSAAFDRAPPTCTPLQDLPQCEPQQRAPDHGSVQCTNTNLIGSVCTFSCGSGYYLSGSINVLICGALGEWSAIPPTCQRITCPPAFNNPTNGVVGCTDGINDGSVCSFGCAPGFSLIGAASSTCADDGNGDGVGLWSQPAPICQAITCSPQHTDPTNGNVNCINGNSLGSDCFFSCVDGYRMSGAPISTCTDDGNGDTNGVWSSPAPTCEPITCIPSHTSPTNGQVTCSNGNLVGSECVFTCSPGYAVTGEPVSICNQVNIGTPAGVWSSPPPTCQPQQCSPPHSNPVDGSVECSDGSNLNSQCDFVCNAGFSILGSPVSTCTVSANNNNNLIWSNPPPMCLPITCIPQQIPPTNGAVTCDNSNNVGSTCTFTCNAGYSVSGSPTTVCNDDFNGDAQGLWSSPPPTCQQQVCSPPHTAPADGSVACSDGSALGSQCEFACSLGFTLVGAPLSTCAVANGNTSPTWSHPAPTCAPVTCLPQQIPPTNGAVTCDNSNNVGSTCTFTCNAGYSVSGSPTTVCNDDFNGDAQGLWSSPPPTCQQLKCNPPQSNPTNGSVSCSDENNVNSECEFACMLGFTMVGEPITDCLMSGGVPAWTNVAPVCGPVICPAQQAPVNGGVTCTAGSNFGSVCSFQCSPGYALTGEPSATCNDDFNQDTLGVWSSPPPTCEPIVCNPRHVEPDNGAVICTNDNNLDSSCTFICANTYAIEGSPVSVCQDSGNGAQGSWSTPPPICTPIVCLPQHSSPANGGVQCTNSNFMGSSCTFTCDVGYDLLGEISSVCNLITATDAIGTWSAPAPICVERSRCSNPPSAPTNGYRVCSDGNYVGSICDYGCDDLYTRVGSQYSTCVELADGSHSFDNPAPTCERSSCRDVQTLPNGNVSCSDGNFINSVCTYDCNAGNAYALFPTNHSTTTCLNDTTWDLPPPCCARRCPPYALMDFVMILDSSSSVRRRNWRIMKNFGRSIIETFRLAEDAARMAAFRYNRVVDTRSQILFRQHVNDMAGFLASYNAIPYNGGGTLTGQALRHAKDVILARRNGNRPNVKDVVLTITDGRSHDNVANVSRELREMGVLTFVVGVVPGNGKQLDENQLLSIAGSRSNMFLATSGFSGLNSAFSARLSESICTNPCAHLLQRDEINRPTPTPARVNGENVPPTPSGR